MKLRTQWSFLVIASLLVPSALSQDAVQEQWVALKSAFEASVDKKLALPEAEQARYADLIKEIFLNNAQPVPQQEYVLAVDRSERVQAAFLYWVSASSELSLVGASPVATGKPGSFEHFKTPLGIFRHSPTNPDYRAEGTRNENGIRGYGKKGMRVFDFGWVTTPKGWGNRKPSLMRLQLHATDPDLLEPKLGVVASKGCVRAPASLIQFLDSYGLLDADYRDEIANGKKPLAIQSTEGWTTYPGRYLVVLETTREARPEWAPLPQRRK